MNTIRFAGLKSDNEVLSKNNTKLKENKEISFGLADKSKEKLNEGFQQKLMSNISESIQKNEEKPTLNLETQKLKDPEEPKKNSMFSNITGPTIFSSHQPVFANKEEIKLPNSNEKVESNKPGLFSNLMNPSKTNLGFNNNGLSAFSSNETKLGLFSQTDNELKLKTSPVKTTLFNYCNPEKILTNPNDNTKKEPFSLFNNNKVENNTDINKTNIFGNLSANSTNSLFGNHSTLNLNHDNGMRNLFGVKTVNNEESTGGLFGPNKITATGLFSNLSNSGPVGNSQQIQNKD